MKRIEHYKMLVKALGSPTIARLLAFAASESSGVTQAVEHEAKLVKEKKKRYVKAHVYFSEDYHCIAKSAWKASEPWYESLKDTRLEDKVVDGQLRSDAKVNI